jgi:hypothetical protein
VKCEARKVNDVDVAVALEVTARIVCLRRVRRREDREVDQVDAKIAVDVRAPYIDVVTDDVSAATD